ncbi:hypothetical protein LBMAG55_12620 [Verrucomicrobiota bacterium]|nr:hypothetical protein LBMAG55_12620 [Verrucomicrobiota bacterium]
MKYPASLACLLVASLAVAADQPSAPRPERVAEPRGDRRPEVQPQGGQPVVIPLPQGLPPGAYMLVPLPQPSGQAQTGRGPNIERPNIERPNIERPNVPRTNVERPNAERANAQPREGQVNAQRGGFAALTPDEQAKLKAAVEKAGQDAAVKESREHAQKAQKALEEARLNERKATEAAALKVDPSLEPILDKLHRAQTEQGANQNRRGNDGGEQPRTLRGEQPAR